MLYRLSLLILLLASTASVTAQLYQVTGTVIDEQGEPMPFATTVLFNSADSAMAKATATDMEGRFELDAPKAGAYYVAVTSVGYNGYSSESFDLTAGIKNLGALILTAGVALDAVNITAEKPMIEVLADKTVFNVESTGTTAGLTGFELLRKAPGVIVDNNDNVMLEGKSGVQIWIDGKPSILTGDDLTAYLRTLQASDIASIELITQPSSKYDAQGTGGIINIKLKRDKRYGTNGSVSTGLAYGRYLKNNNSISLNQRSKGMNVFGNYSNQFGKTFNEMEFDQQILNQLYQERTFMERDGKTHNAKAGADFYISEKSTIGVSANGNFSETVRLTDSSTGIVATAADASTAYLKADNRDETDQQNLFANLNYQFEDTLGHKLTSDIDYGIFTQENTNRQPNTYFDEEGGTILTQSDYLFDTPIEIQLLSAKIDYEQNALKGRIGLGAKIADVQTGNEFNLFQREGVDFVRRDTLSNAFDYTERVLAGYVNYNYSAKKWNAQAGLRVENTYSLGVLEALLSQDDDEVERNYTDFFPSAGVTYNVNQTNSLGLNYSRRINRPNYESLNPFEIRMNELGFRKGNPFLNPSYTDNFKLSHTYQYRFTTSLSYSHTSDFSAQVTDTLSLNNGSDFVPSFIQSRNVADEEVYAISLSAPFDVTEKWSVYLNMTGSHTSYTSIDERFNPISQTTFNAYAQNTFKLPKGWSFEVSGWYSSPSVWGGTFKTKSLGSLDAAISRKFLNDKLAGSLSISDMLYTSPWRAEGEFNNLPITGGGGWESRQVRFNLTYSFGNPELKSRKERKGASEEERGRMN